MQAGPAVPRTARRRGAGRGRAQEEVEGRDWPPAQPRSRHPGHPPAAGARKAALMAALRRRGARALAGRGGKAGRGVGAGSGARSPAVEPREVSLRSRPEVWGPEGGLLDSGEAAWTRGRRVSRYPRIGEAPGVPSWMLSGLPAGIAAQPEPAYPAADNRGRRRIPRGMLSIYHSGRIGGKYPVVSRDNRWGI